MRSRKRMEPQTAVVTITDRDTNGYVVVDAVQLSPEYEAHSRVIRLQNR